MRTTTSLICLSTLSLLTACGMGMPDDGSYDTNGNYLPPRNATTDAQRNGAPNPSANTGSSYSDYHSGAQDKKHNGHNYNYDRRGYYDADGHYYKMLDLEAPDGMMPPRGMCRVWFPDRVPSQQPDMESCGKMRTRVPAGAYMIYGG